ncbi:MAG: class I SAM-dependent methyltransferase [Actinobacteria bacterium]|nr:class I SAM-dependent methyltransferase [Actinomycetota bacterium]
MRSGPDGRPNRYKATAPDHEDRRRRIQLEVAALPSGLTVLDVGAGGSPYRELFDGVARRYVALDLDAPASVLGAAERLPLRDGSVDLIACFQVLEHVESPEATVGEFCRVLRPGGRVLLTTHGTFPYHPDPNDYWRWTGQGLERLFRGQGLSPRVDGMTGTATSIAMLIAYYANLAAKRYRWGTAARRLIPLLHRAGRALDRRVTELSDQRRDGSLFLDYFVVATKSVR